MVVFFLSVASNRMCDDLFSQAHLKNIYSYLSNTYSAVLYVYLKYMCGPSEPFFSLRPAL